MEEPIVLQQPVRFFAGADDSEKNEEDEEKSEKNRARDSKKRETWDGRASWARPNVITYNTLMEIAARAARWGK